MSNFANLIIGLGNHSMLHTRHSIGMQVCNVIASRYDVSWTYKREYKAYVTSINFENKLIMMMKSKLPMNLNGRSVRKVVKDLEIDVSKIIVLHDDLDRKLGKLSWKLNGSAGGHNGVRSIISSLSTDEFKRIRIGIGRPNNRHDVVDYVLEKFTEDELNNLDPVMQKATAMLCLEMLKSAEVLSGQG